MEEEFTVIIPPPEIRQSADAVAKKVAKVGIAFENRLREKEGSSLKFSFIHPSDPYHKYFRQQVIAAEEELKSEKLQKKEEKLQNAEEHKQKMMRPPPIPPPPYEFLIQLPHISKQDLQVVKLTAQFAAKNGTKFLNALSQREHNNFQFEFLKPSNQLYPYFMRLINQYSSILNNPKIDELVLNTTDKNQIMERISLRLEFEAFALDEEEKKRKQKEEEKLAFQTIDWHDFVVVETIEFKEADDRAVLPPPLVLSELESMTLIERKKLLSFDRKDDDTDVIEINKVDMEDDNKTIGVQAFPTGQSNSKKKTSSSQVSIANGDATEMCPICKQQISVSQLQEHIKLELRDPRHEKEAAAYQAKIQETNLVADAQVAENLRRITNVRSDILGSDNFSSQQRMQFEAEKSKESQKGKVIWDGKKNSIASTTAKAHKLSLQHPPPPPGAPPQKPAGQPKPPGLAGVPPQPGPPAKKPRLDPNALSLSVQTPSSGILEFSDLTPLWTVSQVKDRLAQTTSIPVSKQKLVTATGLVLKNAMTLYQCGIVGHTELTLEFKGRGGKK